MKGPLGDDRVKHLSASEGFVNAKYMLSNLATRSEYVTTRGWL